MSQDNMRQVDTYYACGYFIPMVDTYDPGAWIHSNHVSQVRCVNMRQYVVAGISCDTLIDI